jgi:hypothetical protein
MPSYLRDSANLTSAHGFYPLPSDLKLLGAVILQRTWSPIVFKDNYRAKKNFLYSDFVGFDIDNVEGEPYLIKQAIRDFCDCELIIATTRSHQKEKVSGDSVSPPTDRYRMIMRWAQRIEDVGLFEYNVKKILDANPAFDKSAKDGARLFFPSKEIVFSQFEGERLEVLDLPPESAVVGVSDVILPVATLAPHVEAFLQKGIVFGGSRNMSVYTATCELLRAQVKPQEILSIIKKSPFEKRGFTESELKRTVKNAITRFIR